MKINEDLEVSEVHSPQQPREVVASGTAHRFPDPNYIPDESEITLNTISVLGVDVLKPTSEMLLERIPETAPEGGQSRTLKHLNTALTSAGFKDGDRHWASLALVKAAFGGMARTEVKSLKDLTVGEASVITGWLMEAGDEHLSELRRVTSALKGQLVIGEVSEPTISVSDAVTKADGRPPCDGSAYCDEFPFCDHNWAAKEAVIV